MYTFALASVINFIGTSGHKTLYGMLLLNIRVYVKICLPSFSNFVVIEKIFFIVTLGPKMLLSDSDLLMVLRSKVYSFFYPTKRSNYGFVCLCYEN